MIRSFRSKALRRYWLADDRRGIRPDWLDRVRLILSLLDQAAQPGEMDVPGLNFHALRGDQRGRYSVLISRNWRITFGWQGEDAADIDMEDYHGT